MPVATLSYPETIEDSSNSLVLEMMNHCFTGSENSIDEDLKFLLAAAALNACEQVLRIYSRTQANTPNAPVEPLGAAQEPANAPKPVEVASDPEEPATAPESAPEAVAEETKQAAGETTQYLTPREVAVLLNRPLSSVTRYLREGIMPGKKIGGHWTISRAALNEFIRSGQEAKAKVAGPSMSLSPTPRYGNRRKGAEPVFTRPDGTAIVFEGY